MWPEGLQKAAPKTKAKKGKKPKPRGRKGNTEDSDVSEPPPELTEEQQAYIKIFGDRGNAMDQTTASQVLQEMMETGAWGRVWISNGSIAFSFACIPKA